MQWGSVRDDYDHGFVHGARGGALAGDGDSDGDQRGGPDEVGLGDSDD